MPELIVKEIIPPFPAFPEVEVEVEYEDKDEDKDEDEFEFERVILPE